MSPEAAARELEKCNNVLQHQSSTQYFLTLEDRYKNRITYPVDSIAQLKQEVRDIKKDGKFKLVYLVKGERVTYSELLVLLESQE